MAYSEIIATFVALFVIIDPIGLTTVFAALTSGTPARERRAISLRACLVAVVLLTLFGTLGEAVLSAVGISMAAFRISGGILLFIIALDMLFERRTKRREDQSAVASDPAVFPLATPLIAGPGSITTMILISGSTDGDWGALLALHIVMVLVVAVVFVMFLMAGALERVLRPVGILVVTRLLGVLLAALAVQFVLDGLRGVGLVTG